MICILGIDPGQHGGYSIVRLDGLCRYVWGFNKMTFPEAAAHIQSIKEINDILGYKTAAYIEEVHAMPHDGKASAFSFGKNYGAWVGILTALKMGFIEVPPAKWQAGLKLRVRGLEYSAKKKALKEAAQKRFPELNLTLDTCDAALIAEYGRQSILAEKRIAAK